MKDKRILYVSSEVVPYLAENEVSLMSYDVPKWLMIKVDNKILCQRYGNINERRHQRNYERLGDEFGSKWFGYVIIIKVASIPKERIQVYFIDNDDYFKRKGFADEEGVMYPDNDDIPFSLQKVEIKKLNWVPDIIHVHGWRQRCCLFNGAW
jgi:starch synthase